MMISEDTVYYTPERDGMPPDEDEMDSPRVTTHVGPVKSGWRISVVIVLLLIMVVGGSVPAGLTTLYYADFIMPGVKVLDSDLGGHTTTKATQILVDDWAARQVILQGNNHSLTVSPETLGVTLDAAATAQSARRLGREGTTLEGLVDFYRGGAHLTPVWQIDVAQAAANLEGYAYLYEIPASNAQITFDNGALSMTPAATGQTLDIESMTAWLSQHSAQAILEGEAPLLLETTYPTIDEAMLQPAWLEAEAWLGQPLTLRIYDPVDDLVHYVEISSQTWNHWASLEFDSELEQPFTVKIDQREITSFFQAGMPEFGANVYIDGEVAAAGIVDLLMSRRAGPADAPVPLRLYHHDRIHTVQFGETLSSIGRLHGVPYPWIQAANPTIGDSLSVGQQLVIPSVDNFLPLPVVEHKRIVVSISEQKMWAYENGQLAFEWVVSTGIEESPTAPGIFQVQSFELDAYAGNWDLQMPHFIGIYRPVPQSDFMNGFHGFPTRNGYNLLWTGDLGHPVTYGCVLVSSTNAISLFEWAELGVVVEVRA